MNYAWSLTANINQTKGSWGCVLPTDYSLCIWMCVSIDTQTCCQNTGVIPIIIRRKLKTKHRIITLKLTNLKNSTNFNEPNNYHPSFQKQ